MFPRAFSCPGPGFSAGFHHLQSQMGSATLRASPGGTCKPSHPHREPGGASCHIPKGAKPSGRGRWGPALPSCRGAAALSIPASCRQREPARHHPCAAAADGCDIFLEGLGGSDGDMLMLSVPVRSLLMGREQPAGCHMPPSPCCWWEQHRRAPSAVTRLQNVPSRWHPRGSQIAPQALRPCPRHPTGAAAGAAPGPVLASRLPCPLSGALLLFRCFLRCCGVAPLFWAAGAARLGKQLKDVAGDKFSTAAGRSPRQRRGAWLPREGRRLGCLGPPW